MENRWIISFGDASFASIDLLNDMRPRVTMITHLREIRGGAVCW
jgi:hypothetical protein